MPAEKVVEMMINGDSMTKGFKMLWLAKTVTEARAAMRVLDEEEKKYREELRKKHPYYRKEN